MHHCMLFNGIDVCLFQSFDCVIAGYHNTTDKDAQFYFVLIKNRYAYNSGFLNF